MRPPFWFVGVGLLSIATTVPGQTAYKLPPKEVVDLLDAPPPPFVSVSPRHDTMLLIDVEPYPSIAQLAQPILRLGGVRINPRLGGQQRTAFLTGIEVRPLDGSKGRRVELPGGARIGRPSWSPDGKWIAFTLDRDDHIELWVADPSTGHARALEGIRLNDVLGSPFEWTDGSRLLALVVPESRGPAPATLIAPIGPNVEESTGRLARPRTYQDLLRTPHDEALFRHYGTSRPVLASPTDTSVLAVGEPGLYVSADRSPDGKYLLVTRLQEPFSRRVPYDDFAQVSEVIEVSTGRILREIADLPVADDVPPQGVRRGPRAIHWRTLEKSTLTWTEALDDGDPKKKVSHRDRLMSLASPFDGQPFELLKLRHRYSGITPTPVAGRVLLSEYDRERRWRTTSLVDLHRPDAPRTVLFDLSIHDAYHNPGVPVLQTLQDGQRVLLQDGDWAYFAGEGATELGDRPFLDKRNLATGETVRLFLSEPSSLERFVAFVGDGRSSILISHESRTEPSNSIVVNLGSGRRNRLTDFKDPAPQLSTLKKELIRYQRKDGVPLSGTLYLPPGYQAGTRLPLIVWAYPLEYSDASTAGQVRATPNAFTRFRGDSPLYFLTQGYAVLNDATMPVVGNPDSMNDTYIEQIAEAARAAIETLDARGVIDPKRVGVAGHSYGAFMTANLLAHTDLFAAGIARSGAYNRSLTPFGFQGERRSFWEATDLYMKMSPFTYANRVNEPLLLIHGEADNNPGTHPIQSERFYEAVKGNGGTVRLVMLPHESHGYRARESVLHVLAEMFDWADHHIKNRSEAGAR